jgi:hypothetical protein
VKIPDREFKGVIKGMINEIKEGMYKYLNSKRIKINNYMK